jgi:hypothetical protein
MTRFVAKNPCSTQSLSHVEELLCLDLLNELKGQFESNGFDSESDEEILSKLYGNSAHLVATVFDSYRTWSCTADCSDKERADHAYSSIEECKTIFLEDLDNEIRRLNEYKKVRASIDAERIGLESRRQNVPDAPQSDRLLRYETHLERAFDRKLTQLERLQRMRQGQPILPPIKVDVSSS